MIPKDPMAAWMDAQIKEQDKTLAQLDKTEKDALYLLSRGIHIFFEKILSE